MESLGKLLFLVLPFTLSCSPGCHPNPHLHPLHPAQPGSASPSAGPSSGREERGAVSETHGGKPGAATEEEGREGGWGPKKVEWGLGM